MAFVTNAKHNLIMIYLYSSVIKSKILYQTSEHFRASHVFIVI